MIAENILQIQNQLPKSVVLIAVSKTQPVEAIEAAYVCGQRDFGENKAQELMQKHALLPSDIRWHFIGHLQSNKIKYIASYVHLIHSIDSLKLLVEVNKEARKQGRVIDVLLEMFIAEEDSKYGLDENEACDLLASAEFAILEHVRVCGLMGMATFTSNKDQIHREFACLRGIFERIKKRFFSESNHFCEISMGMSDDFQIAIEEGSTLVRLGSCLFGKRNSKI